MEIGGQNLPDPAIVIIEYAEPPVAASEATTQVTANISSTARHLGPTITSTGYV
jgi:hypothetical protein